jgi:hypothetical protein
MSLAMDNVAMNNDIILFPIRETHCFPNLKPKPYLHLKTLNPKWYSFDFLTKN